MVRLISPSLAMWDIGTVYFNPSPPLRGRMTTTAKVPDGEFSASTWTEPCPGLALTASITPSTEQDHDDSYRRQRDSDVTVGIGPRGVTVGRRRESTSLRFRAGIRIRTFIFFSADAV